VTVDAAVVAPEKPVLLHELLHAYHFRVLPGAMQNPDVQRLYDNARQGELFPPDAYVLKNVQEFFAAEPLSLGQCRSPPVQPQQSAREAAGLLSMISSACRRPPDNTYCVASMASPFCPTRSLRQNNSAGKVRGHASLMQPA
jgi:hypothetical protein